jgi:hypothetical protein
VSDDQEVPTTTLSFDVGSSTTISETIGTFEFTVSRRGPIDSEIAVRLSAIDGTAAVGVDYYVFTNPMFVLIPAGQTGATTSVTIIDDPLLEGDETFQIQAISDGFETITLNVTISDLEQ